MSEIKYLPKTANTRGLAVINNNAARTIILTHGIDERGDESEAALKKVATWGGWLNIRDIADKKGYNVIWVNSSLDDTTDEIDYAIKYSEDILKAQTIHLLGFSWGGRRYKLWINRNLEAAKRIKTVMRISSGGVDVDDWTNTIAAKLPTWLIHAIDDQRTSYKNTFVSYQNAVAKDPSAPVWYTQFVAGLDKNWQGHNMLQMVGDWKIASPAKATYLNAPALTLSQWWEMNEWKRGTDPTVAYVKQPEQAPLPVKKPAFILYSDGSWEAV